jgi:hypothetical protein
MQIRAGVALLMGIVCVVGGAQAMKHPGVLVSGQQLDYVKQQVKARKEPIYSQYQKAVANQYAAMDYKVLGPPETGIIDCGAYSRPDHGCHAEDSDASAAYLQAVLWWITRDHRYAANAIRIMNTYSYKVKGYTNANTHLQAAWSAEMWPRAGEIIRHSRAGWKAKDVQAFSDMLTKINLPLIRDGAPRNVGNWQLSMVEGMMGIAVFTDDRALLTYAENMWRERVPAYFYNAKLDGDHPRVLTPGPHEGWFGQTTFDESIIGVAAETCRDLGHTGYAISATIAAAETAHIQGDKLYEDEEPRLIGALEFHAHLLLKKEPAPATLCAGNIRYGAGYTFGIGYNEFHNRLGQPLPETREWLDKVMAIPEPVDIHTTVFEMLTHGADAAQAKR